MECHISVERDQELESMSDFSSWKDWQDLELEFTGAQKQEQMGPLRPNLSETKLGAWLFNILVK